MKKLHLMMVRVYLGPLFVTFLIVLFIFTMQFLWKYVDDLMGKGLPAFTIVQLLFYATATFVPAAIPLAVLLSSIMTMGGLGERSELTPMRSAGLGLFRIMFPLLVVAVCIAGFSFYFSNNVIPVVNLRSNALLYDMREKKPAMTLRPGVFYNGINGFTIRISDKHEDTGMLDDVLIYDHRQAFQGDRTVVRAEHGMMKRSLDGGFLVLELQNGTIHDEQGGRNSTKGGFKPLLRGSFERNEIRLDLSSLALKRTDEDLFKHNYRMLTMGQLSERMDSLERRYQSIAQDQQREMRNALFITRDSASAAMPGDFRDMSTFAEGLAPQNRRNLYDIARNMTRNAVKFIDHAAEMTSKKQEELARFRIEWHRKLVLAVACIIFFFIGAPLGAIVRKGGMGLPAVWAIAFFLVFHIVSYSTEQLVKAGDLGAWPGMWISSFILLPIGVFLTWKAATDSPLLESEAYARAWDKLRAFLTRRARTPTVQ